MTTPLRCSDSRSSVKPDAGAGRADWLHIAREMADDLSTDAAEREQAGKTPLDEVSRLR